MQNNHSTINQYFHHGKNLTLLHGKIPFLENWTQKILSKDELLRHNGNFGYVLDSGDLIVDVDPRNGGKESFERLLTDLNITLTPTVNTPSGGFHCYLKIPASDRKFRQKLKKYPGIDFLTKGSQCVIAGSKTASGKYIWSDDIFGFEQPDAPKELINLISDNAVCEKEAEYDPFEGLVGNSNLSRDRVLDMINKLDPSVKNDDWVKIGMALHSWNQVEGLEIWEKWSQGGTNYQEGETEKRWRSFKPNSGVTMGTLFYMFREVLFDEKSTKIKSFLAKISLANDKELEFELFPQIKKANFSQLDLEKIIRAIQDRYKKILGVKIPISNIRSNFIANNGELENSEIPDWCKNFVYVNSHNAFASLSDRTVIRTESFNIQNGKHVPESSNGYKRPASKFVADNGLIDFVDSIAYLPNTNDSVCIVNNSKVLNSFNPKTIPTEASSYTKEGLEAIELIKKHIKFICSTDENARILTEWLAHNIQFPGEKVLWSPVIQSIQGTGKSYFCKLLMLCLGDQNVGVIAPNQVISTFNGWSVGKCVNVLEELKIQGHSRYEALNSLKPMITDGIIQVNEKGVKHFNAPNTANYICFTNFKDALPLDKDDRRWWVLFCPIESLSEMEKYVGESKEIYFSKLFDASTKFAPEIRKWFLEFEISKEFLKTKQAPMTDYKLSMIATEEANIEGLNEIKELIKKGGEYFNEEVISSSDLFAEFSVEYPELQIEGKKRNFLLKKLGYSAMPRVIKIDEKTKTIWAKKILDNAEIRKSFRL